MGDSSKKSTRYFNTSLWGNKNYILHGKVDQEAYLTYFASVLFCDLDQRIHLSALPDDVSTQKDVLDQLLDANLWSSTPKDEIFKVEGQDELWKYRLYNGKLSYQKYAEYVFERDNFTCQYCGEKKQKLTLDHIIPQSQNGEDNPENLVTACRECNSRKGGRAPKEAGMNIINDPRENKVSRGKDE